MLDALLGVFGNSHFEAYIAGPFFGVIVAALFAGLSGANTRSEERPSLTPREIQIRIEHRYYHSSGQRRQSEDGSWIMGLGLLALVAVFLFAAFLPELAALFNFFIATVGTFAMTATTLSLFMGRWSMWQWWVLAVNPLLISVGCFVVGMEAYGAVSTDVVLFAKSLLNTEHLSLPAIVNGTFMFLKNVHNEYVQWIMFDMGAYLCVVLCGLIAFLQCIHYVALSNSHSGSAFWEKLTFKTRRYGTLGTSLFALILLGIGWFLASGMAYQLLHG